MDNSGLNHTNNAILEIALPWRILVPCIDIIHILFLSLGINGMYCGIEILHPLYMVLFINLILTAISTAATIISFPFMAFDQYLKVCHKQLATSQLLYCKDILNLYYIVTPSGIQTWDLRPLSAFSVFPIRFRVIM